MIETITIITLSVLLLIFFRPGKTPPLDNPLVIERPDQYHMTLAPQLNLAQPFIEAIARQFGTPCGEVGRSAIQCFEVTDKNVISHGHKSYLLAITLINGMLYFQAASPQSDKQIDYYCTIHDLATTVLGNMHVRGEYNSMLNERIEMAALAAAQLRSIQINHLTQ